MTITVRDLAAGDEAPWRDLWQSYCDFYEIDIPDAVTDETWRRLLDDSQPFFALVACDGDDDGGGAVIGFVNCVLHPITWATTPVCYLEDLFVAPEARSRGAGRALIEAVRERGEAGGWHRVYWMTADDNETARALYDKVADLTRWVRYDVPLGASG